MRLWLLMLVALQSVSGTGQLSCAQDIIDRGYVPERRAAAVHHILLRACVKLANTPGEQPLGHALGPVDWMHSFPVADADMPRGPPWTHCH